MNQPIRQSAAIDVNEAAVLLGIRPSTVRKYVLEKRIPYYKIGSRVVFDSEELLNWRSKHHVEEAT